MSDWHFLSLEMDVPSSLLGEHFRRQYPTPPEQIALPDKAAISKSGLERIIRNAIPKQIRKSKAPTLCFSGHGKYHHYTYGLCRALADQRSNKYGYIHIDQHHDMWGDSEGWSFRKLNCGGFVKSIRGNTNASQVLTIGTHEVESKIKGDPNYYYHIPNYELKKKGLLCVAHALAKLPEDVYISIDLDFLEQEEITTGWLRGSFKKEMLLHCLAFIQETKKVIGVDVCGWDANDQVGNTKIRYTPDAIKALAIHYDLAGLVLNP